MPENLELVLENEVYIAKEMLPPSLRNRLLRLAAFQNPEFYKAQAMRLPTYDKPRVIACAEDHPHYIGLPRGCLDDVRELLSDLRIKPVIRDERCKGKPLEATFHGELRFEQKVAADALIAQDIGVLSATTAFGKTVVAAWLIAKRGVNTPVLVHRRQLFDRRCRGYEAVGYAIQLPASAVPGWPTEVPLPVDPEWKKDYAASVRRLVCDGVDASLANVFSQTAPTIPLDAEGASRARSATEAFLYRRLERCRKRHITIPKSGKAKVAFLYRRLERCRKPPDVFA